MRADRRVARIVSLAASALTAAAVLLPPTVYFLLSYQHAAGSLEAEADFASRSITVIVGADPELWRYEQVRLSEHLARRPRTGEAERRRVLDSDGDVVADVSDALAAPVITRSRSLLDAGARVGTVEISRSLLPLLARAGLLGLILLPLGMLALSVMRNVPLRAIRESEAALRRERDTAQKYLDVAGVAFVILDRDGRVTLLNRKGAEILGASEAEVVGKEWVPTFVDAEDRSRVAAELALALPGAVLELEYGVLCRSGRRIVSWYVTPLAPEGGLPSGLLGSGIDVTQQRQLEDRLRQAQKLEAVGLLAAGVAHDFNNILSAIKGCASSVRNELADDDPHRPDLDEVVDAADRATAITRSLLTFSRRQFLKPEPVDLVEVTRRADRLLRALVREDVHLDVELPEAPLPILADAVQIEQVLVNLVANARDVTREGERIAVSVSRVDLDAEGARQAGVGEPGPYARVSVKDDGPGIDAEAQARIFEPFFTTKAIGKGTGLGLAIAYGIVTQHRGAIGVVSELGRGATFTFFLPLTGVPLPRGERSEKAASPPGGGETLLVAEDDESVRWMLGRILRSAGYEVVEAVDGKDAVRRFEENNGRVGLVILDVVMPGQNGRLALDAIRKLAPETRALYLSGYADDPSGRDTIDLGGDLLVAKPVDPDDLLRAIRRALDG